MFPAMVALNRNVSCGTNPMCRRNAAGDRSRRSVPSSSTHPPVGSIKRGTRPASVLLPAPVCPTTATVAPAAIVTLTLSSARPEGYATEALRNSISPRTRARRTGCAGAAIEGFSWKIWLMRASEAPPRCIRFTTHPSAIMGHTRIPM